MEKYDVFDFDKTLYKKDSTVMFYLYGLRKHIKIYKYLPKTIINFIKYQTNIITKIEFKQEFFKYLEGINDIDKDISDFWDKNKKNIRTELLKSKNKKIVISASPEFLLKDICNEIGIERVIATKVDKKTGKFSSENCYGAEKVKRFHEEYKNVEVENFYSDSLSDQPMADISKHSYLIKKNKVKDWK